MNVYIVLLVGWFFIGLVNLIFEKTSRFDYMLVWIVLLASLVKIAFLS